MRGVRGGTRTQTDSQATKTKQRRRTWPRCPAIPSTLKEWSANLSARQHKTSRVLNCPLGWRGRDQRPRACFRWLNRGVHVTRRDGCTPMGEMQFDQNNLAACSRQYQQCSSPHLLLYRVQNLLRLRCRPNQQQTHATLSASAARECLSAPRVPEALRRRLHANTAMCHRGCVSGVQPPRGDRTRRARRRWLWCWCER